MDTILKPRASVFWFELYVFFLLAGDQGLCLGIDNNSWNWYPVLSVNAYCRFLFLLLPALWEMWRGDVTEGQSE